MELAPGQRVLDLGCGVGVIGVLADRRVGPEGAVTFADSNVRAIALAELNARANGLTNFTATASHTLTDWPDGSFDVVLANPPYYAQGSIIHLFIERSKALLRTGGVLYLVTKQVDLAWPMIQEHFPEPEMFENRGYVIFRATKA
jgi:16S rRNA (guanine1207-N2)-methyltransferase